MKYDIYCDFDIEKHKQTYIDYLEVLILENGKVVYAVPSHQTKAEQLCCEKLGVTHKELLKICPREYWGDYLTWLLTTCDAVSVWNEFYLTGKDGINTKQKQTLKQLKLSGLYRGAINATH